MLLLRVTEVKTKVADCWLIRLSDEEELYVFAKMKELGYHSISEFLT